MKRTIPVQSIAGAEPLFCTKNVEKRIRALGGAKVFGWEVDTKPGLFESHLPHCVWQSPEGRLEYVTPKFTGELEGDLAIADWPETIEFIPDPALAWEGRCPHSGRYIALDKRLTRACEYMSRADRLLFDGDLERCRYWTEKANQIAKKLGFYWPVPESLGMKDFVRSLV